ncbi:MAG: RHS repeat-associated core domain-containing protein [Ruminiclostridium sp.]|nr:RHS repeat-associated core domain-containing protein [Ruminiclostridium sp.]
MASTLGAKNPFRYRGYYYDTETGYYYLNSRYYDPVTGRFLNAEPNVDIGGFDSGAGLLGYNVYAYCANNPVMYKDENGEFLLSALIIGAAVGAVIGGAVSAISQQVTTGEINVGVVVVNAVAGAISGALATTGIGLGLSVGANAALGVATYVGEQVIKGEEITLGGVAVSFIAGGAAGAIGGRGLNAEGLRSAWKSASKGLIKEGHRANTKYAAKQIVKYTAEQEAVKDAIKISFGRFVLGTIGGTYTRFKLGY